MPTRLHRSCPLNWPVQWPRVRGGAGPGPGGAPRGGWPGTSPLRALSPAPGTLRRTRPCAGFAWTARGRSSFPASAHGAPPPPAPRARAKGPSAACPAARCECLRPAHPPGCAAPQVGASAVPGAVAAAVGGQQVRLDPPAGVPPKYHLTTWPVFWPSPPANMPAVSQSAAEPAQGALAVHIEVATAATRPPTRRPNPPPLLQEGDALRVLRLAAARLEGHADAAVRGQCACSHECQL